MKLYFASATCSLLPHIVLQELKLPYDLVRVDNCTKRTSEDSDCQSAFKFGSDALLMMFYR